MPEQDRAGVGAANGTVMSVLACHRNALFIDALAELMEAEQIEIRAVSTAEEMLESKCADACLVDVHVEGALDAVANLTWHPKRVVAYVDGTDPRQLSAVLEAGATAWVSAADGFDRLVRVLRSDQTSSKNDRVIAERHLLRNLQLERESSLLTARELDVLLGLVEGQATKELALRLNVSAATVRTHVHNVLAKLGVHTRLQAVALAVEADLVRLSEDTDDAQERDLVLGALCQPG